MIITCHGGDIFPKKTGHDFDNLKYIFSQVDAVTCPSKWLCNYLFRNYGVKSYFVPNGVDTNKFKKLANVSKEKNTILYFGRIHHRKGILNLIHNLKSLTKRS